jgi:hypothetical protein
MKNRNLIISMIADCEDNIRVISRMRQRSIILDEDTTYEDKRLDEENKKLEKLKIKLKAEENNDEK